MNDPCRPPSAISATPAARWSAGPRLLQSLAARDFATMEACFEPAATMRALLPRGPVEIQGAAGITENFRCWFGNAEEFEVVAGTVGEVGGRLHLAWRFRVRPTPWGDDQWHVVEQQAYVRAGERVDAIDLLCTGFMPDRRA